MQQDVNDLINQCESARDLVYSLAKIHKSYIRLNLSNAFEIFQDNTWKKVNDSNYIIDLILNHKFLESLWLILNKKVNEGNVRAKMLSDDLVNTQNNGINSLFYEAFRYHCFNEVTGPTLYFIGLDDDTGFFEPVTYMLYPSRNVYCDINQIFQQNNYCVRNIMSIQCANPENLITQLNTYIEHKRISYLINKFQITETDIINLCFELRVWAYLRKIDFM